MLANVLIGSDEALSAASSATNSEMGITCWISWCIDCKRFSATWVSLQAFLDLVCHIA